MKCRIVFLFVMGWWATLALSAEFQVATHQKNQVKFISHAPLETFEGVTDKIDGYLFFEDSDFTQNSELYFEVDLNSLDTGIGLRNRHMRENYLETDQFPLAHFTGKIVRAQPQPDSTIRVTVEGSMFIHGVKQPLTVQGKLIPVAEGFRVVSEFEVKLTDYAIKVPKLMFMKIDEHMKIQLNFFISRVPEKN